MITKDLSTLFDPFFLMWFAKDGPRPDSQSGPGVQISKQEAQLVVANHQVMFVGTEPPSINPDAPTYSEPNVVLEVASSEDGFSSFQRVGFHLVTGISRPEAWRMLAEYRGRA